MTQVSTTTFSNIFLNGNYLLPKCPEQLKKFLNLRRTFSAIRVAAPRTAAAARSSRRSREQRTSARACRRRPRASGKLKSSRRTRTRRSGLCRPLTRRKRLGKGITTTSQNFNKIQGNNNSNSSSNNNNISNNNKEE